MSHFRFWLACCAAFAAASLYRLPNVNARPLYLKVYREIYQDPVPQKDGATKCALCHAGQDKKTRNDYGKLVEEALEGKNVKDVEVIKAALKKVGPAPEKTPR